MNLDWPDDELQGIAIAGPTGRLIVTFDPNTLADGRCFDGFPRAAIAFDALGLHAVGGFSFFGHDLAPFVNALEQAHRTLIGTATLESEDGDFWMTVDYGDGSEVTVSGHLQPILEEETILRYSVTTDQSYLGPAVAALKALLGS
jgi:hypothetical protein